MSKEERPEPTKRTGEVVSNRMDKTISVEIERQIKHDIYGKYISKTNKYMAHDEDESANEGDIVQIISTRPISKHKSWRLAKIIERAK